MYTRLPSLLASGRHFRRLMGVALGAGLLLGATSAAQAQTVYGLGTSTAGPTIGGQGLITINLTTGLTNTFAPTPITYVTSGGVPTTGLPLVGMDFRPATGVLYGLGYNGAGQAQLYTIDPATGFTTAVAPQFALALGGPTDRIGFDFNPQADRIRVVSTTGANFRLVPTTSAIAATDGPLAYAATDTNAGTTPRVGTGAYTNSVTGAAPLNTLLYDLDELNNDLQNNGFLTTQNPPNSGTLNTVGPLRLNNPAIGVGSARGFDLDIYFNPTTGQNVAYLEEVNNVGGSNLYTLNLETGLATLVGNTIPQQANFEIRDIAAVPSATLTTSGQLLYAVSGGQLVSFLSDSPSLLRSTVALGSLNAGETLAGLDFRPATGELYALGYDPATTNTRLYTVNVTTGALTPIGTGPVQLPLGGASDRIGFDFNPTVDRIRVVSTNRADYRLVPTTGAVAATDGTLTAGPVISAAAYTNNQSSSNSTTLYDYDATNANLYIQNPPNNGTLVLVGPSGLTVPTTPRGADFDIYNIPSTTTNTAYLSVNSGASLNDQLFTVDLASGAATPKGTIGNGGDVSGLAAFISAGTLLTWNGSVSTDWLTAANWTPAQVPTANNDVVIPSGTPNQPTISASNGTGKQARNITLNSGAVLTLADNGVLLIGGNFTNNSGSVAALGAQGNGRVVLTGASPHTLAGTLTTFPILNVSAATTLAGPVSISKGLQLASNLTSTGQTLTLLSSAAGTAYVANSGGTIVGNVTVQRYIDPSANAGVGYRHYSSPVSGNTVADFATAGYSPEVSQAAAYNSAADPTQVSITPFPTIFKYNEGRVITDVPANGSRDFDRGYEVPASTAEALETARGYTVNISAAALVDFTGTANNGATPISVSGLTRGSLPQSGWHLRGNPFPSPLDWQRMVTNGRLSGVDNALYVFKSSGQYTGSYASYINGVATNGGSNSLPVGQGFFVRTSAPGTSGSLTFTNAERDTATTAQFQRGTADTRPQLALSLSNATARTQMLAYFEQGATAAFDRAFDATALPNANGLQLATEAGAELLAINGQGALTGADVLLPLQLAVPAAGTYSLAVDHLAHLPAAYHAYLRDALTGTFTDLAATPALALNLAPGTAPAGRFALLFTPQARVLANAPAALAQLASLYPNPAHGAATLRLPLALRGSQATAVSLVDNLGRTVQRHTLPAGAGEALELPLAGLAPGVYSVLARTPAGIVAKRLVVQ
ncbi:DUF4394 domain-containing protein [Hymenobacter negativus]|uniref:DUF4394 domain-containing protein n=1 Tax=Hymenobacter negativus TaxID=2795026 RepID=A0ABS3QNW3_9BACT|nr:DUF4394 domain-containing protein [Hymenobacter negativus]MBO2012608.1 DUF4394 domain-containing protein [Hymenobacter negativus]